jgi:hypothetical protein
MTSQSRSSQSSGSAHAFAQHSALPPGRQTADSTSSNGANTLVIRAILLTSVGRHATAALPTKNVCGRQATANSDDALTS